MHPQSRAALEALNDNLRREQLARHNAMATLRERREHDSRLTRLMSLKDSNFAAHGIAEFLDMDRQTIESALR